MYKTVYSTANNEYQMYEKHSPSQYTRRCIDNTVTGSNNCVGYCRFSEHTGFLTKKHREQHNCLGKQCHYYLSKPEKEKVIANFVVDLSATILSLAQRAMVKEECIRVIKVKNTEYKRYTAFYITITNEYELEDYAYQIQQELGVDVDFVRLNYDFDKCVALLCRS